MIFIKLNNNSENDGSKSISAIHYKPELLTQEELSKGYLVEQLPVSPNESKGFLNKLYFNEQTQELFYKQIPYGWVRKLKDLTVEEILEIQQVVKESEVFTKCDNCINPCVGGEECK